MVELFNQKQLMAKSIFLHQFLGSLKRLLRTLDCPLMTSANQVPSLCFLNRGFFVMNRFKDMAKITNNIRIDRIKEITVYPVATPIYLCCESKDIYFKQSWHWYPTLPYAFSHGV